MAATLSNDAPDRDLLHSLKHYKALHERVFLLRLDSEDVSHMRDEERLSVEPLGAGMFQLVGRYGYMEEIDVPALLELAGEQFGLHFEPMDTTYFLGRETVVPTRKGLRALREKLFTWMTANAESAARFFRLPPNRVVELGAQIQL